VTEAPIPGPASTLGTGFAHLPTTKHGRWAMWLFVTCVVAVGLFLYFFLPIQGTTVDAGWRGVAMQIAAATMVWTGLAGSGFALFALVRQHERSWTVYLATVPLAFLVLAMLVEILSAFLGQGAE